MIVQNDKIPIGLDLNLLFKDKQRVLDPVVVHQAMKFWDEIFVRGENCNIPDPKTLI